MVKAKKRKNLREKGITLVALVLTIIILLILAGISIAALTNTGIFARAQEAKNITEEKAAEESATLQDYLTQIDLQLGRLSGKAQPGDYVTYTPDTASTDSILTELGTYSGNTDDTKNITSTLTQEMDLKWRVLDVKDGKVRLISEVPTTSTVALEGAKGYNNAVYLLDKTCKTLYSKAGYSEKVQNLKIEDIQEYLTYDYTQYTNTDANIKYGEKKEYITYKNYPNLFTTEQTGWIDGRQGTGGNLNEQKFPINEESMKAETSIKITQTYWDKLMAESDFTNPIYYNLFINNGSNYDAYWMSSRCVYAYAPCADFCVREVESGRVYGGNLYFSNDKPSIATNALRPVITLNSNVLVKSGDGTSTTPYVIGLQ